GDLRRHAGVEHRQVDPAEALERGGAVALDVLGRADVGRQRERVFAQLRGDLLERLRADVDERDLDALLVQAPCGRRADAVRGTGDHCDLAFESSQRHDNTAPPNRSIWSTTVGWSTPLR